VLTNRANAAVVASRQMRRLTRKRNIMQSQNKSPDVLVANAGTVFTFCPLTARAEEWIAEHVQDDAQWFGNALVVEHRYAWDWRRA
jgi:hypothetical protein